MPRKPKPLVDPFQNPRPLFARKIFLQDPDGGKRMYLENPLMTFAELAGNDLLTTRDLQRLFGRTARTVYRWITKKKLAPEKLPGRDNLFRKDKLIKWYRRTWK